MKTDKLIDDLLDSYGALEVAHDRFCAAIQPGLYDRQRLIRLYLAAAAYSRSVEALKDAALSEVSPIRQMEMSQGCPFDPSSSKPDRRQIC